MTSKNLIKLLGSDRQLLTIMSGIICSGIALVTLVVTAGVWYL